MWHHLAWVIREGSWTQLRVRFSGGEGIREKPRPFFLPLGRRAMAEKGVKRNSTKTKHVFGGRLLDGGSSTERRLTTEATSAALVPSSKVGSRLQ